MGAVSNRPVESTAGLCLPDDGSHGPPALTDPQRSHVLPNWETVLRLDPNVW